MNFYEFRIKVDSFHSEKEKIQFIMQTIFDANKVDEIERIPILIATVEESDVAYNLLFARKIRTLWANSFLNNHFQLRQLSSLIGDINLNNGIESGDKIVFLPSKGRLERPNELIGVSTYYAFHQLGLPDNATRVEVLNKLKSDGRFEDYSKEICELLDSKKEYIEMMNEAQVISERLKQLREAKAQAETEYNSIKSLINEIAPEGIEKLKGDIDELKTQLPKLEHQKDNLKEECRAIEEKYLEMKQFIYDRDDTIDYSDRNKENQLDLDHNNLLIALSRMDHQYPMSKIYEFIMALNTNQIITLCGKPGCGKTTFVSHISKALGAICHIIEVQNNWTDRSDLLGYYNPINRTYQSTAFLDALLEAKKEENECGKDSRLHIICLDEMNLSRIEYYFATFLSLLQLPGRQKISLLPRNIQQQIKKYGSKIQGDYFELNETERMIIDLQPYLDFDFPANVRFVGTMNVDQTTNFFSPKVIDRSLYIDFDFIRENEEMSSNERENIDINAYFPVSAYKENAEDVLHLVNDSFIDEKNKRLSKYASEMWPLYKRINSDAPYQFAEELLLTKVLPKIMKASEYEKYKELGLDNANKRYRIACDTGRELDNDPDAYSFFGGN